MICLQPTLNLGILSLSKSVWFMQRNGWKFVGNLN